MLNAWNELSIQDTSEQITKLNKAFIRGMKDKKVHEVERLSFLVNKLNKENDVQTVIDIGAGKGYISQVLALQFGLNVINLEGQSTHNEGNTVH